jgi:endogenous inhibitor of DNA gyrase (YacG/DUF329 family)
MDCPFTPARLRELHWDLRFDPPQLAVLASVALEREVTEAAVLAWLREAGIALRPAARPVPAATAVTPHPRALKPKPVKAPRPGPVLETRPCARCTKAVTRPAWKFRGKDRVFCNPGCFLAWTREQERARYTTLNCAHCGQEFSRRPSEVRGAELNFCCKAHHSAWLAERKAATRALRRSQAGRDLTQLRRCGGPTGTDGCGALKPLSDYTLNPRRQDGRNRLCRPCADAKSKRYYEANQERLREQSRERKARKRAEKETR